jgi:hypothetical protein
MFAGLGPFNRSQVFLATPDLHSYEEQKKPTRVEVTFDGLMLFQKVGDRYEVGIVDRSDHKFVVVVGNGTRNQEPQKPKTPRTTSGGHWTLQVVTDSVTGTPSPKPPHMLTRAVKGCDRLADSFEGEDLEHVFDFCWIMDLEREFNGNQPLTLKPGLLSPIIWLNQGLLYTKYKYDELKREQSPDGTYSRFGFVAQTIALRVDLQEGEHLELRRADGSLSFCLPTVVDGETVVDAAILNAPLKKYQSTHKRGGNDHSHFLYYYELFSNVNAQQKVDIWRKEKGRRPLNRWFLPDEHGFVDDIRILTFDSQACGAALLGLSTQSLK